MPTTLTIKDGTTPTETHDAITLEFLTERIDVRELIRSRVYQEVKDYNAKLPEHFRGLVQPEDYERTLNGYRKLTGRRQIDWEKQFERAIEGFEAHRILILVDEKQVQSLDDEIVITPETNVTFLRLLPLVGG